MGENLKRKKKKEKGKIIYMTFKEALEFKKKLGYDKYKKESLTLIVFVTPFLQTDILNYCSSLDSTKLPNDEDCIPFSTDNQFSVCGIGYKVSSFFFERISPVAGPPTNHISEL